MNIKNTDKENEKQDIELKGNENFDDNEIDDSRSNTLWRFIPPTVFLLDTGLIILFMIKGWTTLLVIMALIALGGAYYLRSLWNRDERTQFALVEASYNTGRIYGISLTGAGIIMLALSLISNLAWEIGATIVVCAILSIYLEMFLALRLEREMR